MNRLRTYVLVALFVSAIALGAWGCGVGGNCDAVPTCEPGGVRVESCPEGADCYQQSTCGRTITCKRAADACDAPPSCDPGDREVLTCPDTGDCYSREGCGRTITCVPGEGPVPDGGGDATDVGGRDVRPDATDLGGGDAPEDATEDTDGGKPDADGDPVDGGADGETGG